MFEDKIKELDEEEKLTLLAMTMVSMRGSWTYTIERGKLIKELAVSLYPNKILSSAELGSLIRRAKYFIEPDEYVDGRVFRDSAPTYDEIWERMKRNIKHLHLIENPPPDVLKQMKKVYNLILTDLDDLSYDELYEE